MEARKAILGAGLFVALTAATAGGVAFARGVRRMLGGSSVIRPGNEGRYDPANAATWPGAWSESLDALNPEFRARIDRLTAAMAARGYRLGKEYRAGSTWRSPERQRWLKAQGWSTVTTSFHTATKADGTPDARAVDFWPLSMTDSEAAKFYTELWQQSIAFGLRSGASFSQTDPRWAKYGLGWDPGHVETREVNIAQANQYNPSGSV